MDYPSPDNLQLPLSPYAVGNGYLKFGDRIRRHVILWATHLGDDALAAAGTSVVAIGSGRVVLAEMRLGSEAKRAWGGVVIIGHKHRVTGATFYSVYGHLGQLSVVVGQEVSAGTEVGVVGASYTPENGWWKVPHAHFAIYTGPWALGQLLPGYKRPEQWRTRLKWWQEPKQFIEAYNRA